jgi:serine/threonine protein phosphatase PrpC
MSNSKAYLKTLLSNNNISVPANRNGFFDTFCESEHNKSIIEQILRNQKKLMANWEINNRIQDIHDQALSLLNGTVGKPYQFTIDLQQLRWADVVIINIADLNEIGLQFDKDTNTISGIPAISGDHQFVIFYKLIQEDDIEARHQKKVSLIINPDPKSLWKDIPGDKNELYWKEDNSSSYGPLGDKQIVVASKRGRSHANQGTFRDDDYAWGQLPSGWSQVVLADGAGSAKYSRKGSEEACKVAIEYFEKIIDADAFTEFDNLVVEQHHRTGTDTLKNINLWIYQNLGTAAFYIHKHLEQCAANMEVPLTHLHTTLIFTLFKKYEFGYAILSFGIGDCPIVLINKDITEITLMNWLDVGEYGGGTRFITMPEVFNSERFSTRFNFKLVEDLAYLIMMTDGIYDPKFEVEANLEKPEHWKAFFNDLDGNNPDGRRVILNRENAAVADELSKWMDFWSPGNHDDRTLAIIY